MLTMSIPAVLTPESLETASNAIAEDLLKRADMAVYEAKRSSIEWLHYTESMDTLPLEP